MTLQSFGKATPIQMDMLNLVGYEDVGRDLQPAKSLNARKRAIREGEHSLKKATGEDFGYDAAAWREFLITMGNEFGYTHPYAFETVDRAVVAAMSQKEYQGAVEALQLESR